MSNTVWPLWRVEYKSPMPKAIWCHRMVYASTDEDAMELVRQWLDKTGFNSKVYEVKAEVYKPREVEGRLVPFTDSEVK